ncbi:hypothetical protein ACFFJI_12235 [Allobacillus sp. GCM10007491]|uniref:Uncharacterized protein n=1 Tax=Allobacillus saliphilus TaxID=2912308 RepID=A0A941CVU7_9BACI|nr:hypothetical protein [Allobacillus saliphilus]MBR7553456.1 hypothetical protein [Allobacillus saliphilus]
MPYIQINDLDIEVAPFEDLAQARQFCTDEQIVVKYENTFYVVNKTFEENLINHGYEKV